MFKTTPMTGGIKSRCRLSTLLLIAFMALTFSSLAQAIDQHGAGMTKGCGPAVRTCDTDADCDGENNNMCIPDICNLEAIAPGTGSPGIIASETYECEFTVFNEDDFDDSINILTPQDLITIFAAPGTFTVVPPDLTIAAVDGNATCAGTGTVIDPWMLPCVIGPAGDAARGEVTFSSNTYEPTMDDWRNLGSLIDQATATVTDNCDGPTSKGDPICDFVAPIGAPGDINCNCITADPLNASDQQSLFSGCESGSEITCDDSNLCTTDSCDPATGCVYTPNPPCNDNNLCTTDSCDPAIGCVYTPNPPCNDNNACTTDSCDPATGCVHTPNPPCNDNNLCTTDSCDPATGCVHTPNPPCNDNNSCTDDSCDPAIGCVHVDNGTCGAETCRTPGYWGSHGGIEKAPKSENVTLAVIGSGLDVCGGMITNTDLGNNESAIEAICINKGDPLAKLYRNLTSSALNCALETCSVNTAALVQYCNGICAADDDPGEISFCSGALDCFNNGGHINADMTCSQAGMGECTIPAGQECELNSECNTLSGGTCVLWENCHNRSLCEPDGKFCFEGGPASSPKKCNEARKLTPYIFELPDPTP